jgi:transposase-like protein
MSTSPTAAKLSCSWSGRLKARVGPMLGFKRFFNARRVLAGIEVVHKIIKGQFGLPESFGTDPFHVWYNVLAA